MPFLLLLLYNYNSLSTGYPCNLCCFTTHIGLGTQCSFCCFTTQLEQDTHTFFCCFTTHLTHGTHVFFVVYHSVQGFLAFVTQYQQMTKSLWQHSKNYLSLRSLQHSNSGLVSNSNQTLSINSDNLIPALKLSVTGRSASREDSFDVDWQVAMRTPMTTHDTETQALGTSF